MAGTERMARKLKVYRTPIGFHDAYIAAPSQKAALAAWGSDGNLFARGQAEIVEDPELAEEPLAHPGKVIKRLRGSADEHMAALPANAPANAPVEGDKVAPSPRPRVKAVPRPDRSALDAAEDALAEAETRHRAEQRRLAEAEAKLKRERRESEEAQDTERERLQIKLDTVKRAYDRAMETWRG